MACDYHLLPHPGIQTLTPYIPGKSTEQLASEQNLGDIIKLASNENPLGCSHKVTNALCALSGHTIATYPAPAHSELLKSLAQKYALEPNMLTLGCGSDMLFPLIINCFALHTGKHILVHDYAFASYQIFAQILGVQVKSTPVNQHFEVDIEAMIKACNKETAIVFLANPNNPTGLLLSEEKVLRLLQHIPKSTLLVLDQAYAEYDNTDYHANSLSWLKQHPNLILTRTFSKAYGLAGLRLGYAIASPDITTLLWRISPPFGINQASLAAAEAALTDTQFIKETRILNKQGLSQLKEGLKKLNLSWLPTAGNFITINFEKDAGPIYQCLLRQGIIVRPLHPYGMDNYLRVTVGTMQQNNRFLEALFKVC